RADDVGDVVEHVVEREDPAHVGVVHRLLHRGVHADLHALGGQAKGEGGHGQGRSRARGDGYLPNGGPMTTVPRPPMSSQRAIHWSLVSRLTPSGVTTAARPKPLAGVMPSRGTL